MLIRTELLADYDVVRELYLQVFADSRAVDLVEQLRDAAEYHPDLSLVAVIDNNIVGHIMFSLVNVADDLKRLPALGLMTMAVCPEYQRQGVGTHLLEYGLRRCHQERHHLVIAIGCVEFYPRFGFKKASQHGIYAPFTLADDAFLVLALRPQTLGRVQGTVIYPEFYTQYWQS